MKTSRRDLIVGATSLPALTLSGAAAAAIEVSVPTKHVWGLPVSHESFSFIAINSQNKPYEVALRDSQLFLLYEREDHYREMKQLYEAYQNTISEAVQPVERSYPVIESVHSMTEWAPPIASSKPRWYLPVSEDQRSTLSNMWWKVSPMIHFGHSSESGQQYVWFNRQRDYDEARKLFGTA